MVSKKKKILKKKIQSIRNDHKCIHTSIEINKISFNDFSEVPYYALLDIELYIEHSHIKTSFLIKEVKPIENN